MKHFIYHFTLQIELILDLQLIMQYEMNRIVILTMLSRNSFTLHLNSETDKKKTVSDQLCFNLLLILVYLT